jgi:hypothetical protein
MLISTASPPHNVDPTGQKTKKVRQRQPTAKG